LRSALPVAHALFSTPFGDCGLAWTARGLARVQLPERTPAATWARMVAAVAFHDGASTDDPRPKPWPPAEASQPLSLEDEGEAETPSWVADAMARLTSHLGGRADDLSAIPLDMAPISPFFRRVYEEARAVPRGEVRTYAAIAAAAGSPAATRAVGQAMARNPWPVIVPCHRIVGSAGSREASPQRAGSTPRLASSPSKAPACPSQFLVGKRGRRPHDDPVARTADRLHENQPGDYFVDSSCIDCDTCRQIAPETYVRLWSAGQSIVFRQPETHEQRLRAAMALVACPTASIGTLSKADIGLAVSAFPEPIAPDVYYCGYAAESSFGASSYLLVRPGGNVLVDSPRAAGPLLDGLAALGGVRTMILTHRDDVADHEAIHRAFGCERVIHEGDVDAGTATAERKLRGREPVRLDAELTVIPVPGHTRGSVALLYRDDYLFSGDHVWYESERRHLNAARSVCWYSWTEQTRSMVELGEHAFQWVLPGHGRRWRAPSREAMRAEVRALAARMAQRS
jgi:O-6-methylguanine DNA methyltransferase